MKSMNTIWKKPSAWIPIALSLAMLAFILTLLGINGVPTEMPEDEGVGAHLFQLWLVLEAPMIFFFAFKWLPRNPKEATFILILQVIAVLAACFPVYYFQL